MREVRFANKVARRREPKNVRKAPAYGGECPYDASVTCYHATCSICSRYPANEKLQRWSGEEQR